MNDELISAPKVLQKIPGGIAIISGNFTPEESTSMGSLLR